MPGRRGLRAAPPPAPRMRAPATPAVHRRHRRQEAAYPLQLPLLGSLGKSLRLTTATSKNAPSLLSWQVFPA